MHFCFFAALLLALCSSSLCWLPKFDVTFDAYVQPQTLEISHHKSNTCRLSHPSYLSILLLVLLIEIPHLRKKNFLFLGGYFLVVYFVLILVISTHTYCGADTSQSESRRAHVYAFLSVRGSTQNVASIPVLNAIK